MANFLQPGISNPDDKFVASEHKGALLLFFPTQLQTGIATAHGTADAVATRVVNLNTGQVLDNALIFATALVTQLKAAVPDGMVLGTLGQGENTKGNPPWLLFPHTGEQVAIAKAYIAANPVNKFNQPAQSAPPTPAVSAPAWGQTPPAAAPAAPATGGWGNPAPAAPAPSWQAPVAPPVSQVHPGLVEALRKKGVPVPPEATQELAESAWEIYKNQPDVA